MHRELLDAVQAQAQTLWNVLRFAMGSKRFKASFQLRLGHAVAIVDTLITNDEEMESYKLLAKPLVESFGGEYLARGGQLVVKENQLWSPTRLVLLRFPSMVQAQSFYDSPAYQQILPISQSCTQRTLVMLEGL